METGRGATEAVKAEGRGTYDPTNQVGRIKAIDLAMRHYFDADDWLAVRNRLFPGLRPRG